ncbi:type VII secretion-associated serine protease mycosin [Nocardia sp. CDC153]|uniref:type VII secretion-associated serine protease mycosin n=1 Tax=Nocardia sp. CDC153 TaxID=3112167 RepID=UPI002DB7A74D|nr:type VII secretion-associated serine protease mycosin [Nocardia sp. CDC153]MEC3954994.1 type VII secretion-associated serine protease mycosin [Nocardia sp. CDC153]
MSRRPGNWTRILCAAAVLGGALLLPQATASASVSQPTADLSHLGEVQALAGKPAPLVPTQKNSLCVEQSLKGDTPRDEPVAQKVLDLQAVWQANPGPNHKGAGQKVAVIDTGVNRHPRLPFLQPGGDYVSDGDGTTEDCDGHGTLVAGIIGAQPSADDAFVGVAPDAEILSIRQLSDAYKAKDSNGGDTPGSMSKSGYGNMQTLAAAVVRAVNLGATVINISEDACTAAGGDTADAALGDAVRFAYEQNVVVVVAAGNVDQANGCGTQNDSYSNTKTGWDKVKTISSPAWFNKYVLPVASVDPTGGPSSFSLYGPWVGVAAIGTNIVSLDNKPGGTGLVNATSVDSGQKAINGTSFAAPYVAGLAALVKAKYPDWSARQVMNQIMLTAHQPGTGRDDRIGAGLIDPVAALTTVLPAATLNADTPEMPIHVGADKPQAFPAPVKPKGPPRIPRLVATIGTVFCLSALGIGLAVSIPFRRRRPDDELPDLDS